ncbi:MAG: hypothetical protein KAH11_00015 [Rhodospirillales bacterium]|nr:hypothetical protein [Rhodospirillales bacterium]
MRWRKLKRSFVCYSNAIMIELAAALALLVLTHLVPSAPGVRPACVRALGLTGFRVAYSLVSLGVVAWMIAAYIAAAGGPWLWTPPVWARWVAVMGMPVALWLIAVRLLERPGEMRTGIYRLIPAPGSAGILLWALLHLLNVGHARAVMLFGVFAAIGAIAMVKNTLSAPPPAAPEAGETKLRMMPVIYALAVWMLLLLLHPVVIGVDPLALILP